MADYSYVRISNASNVKISISDLINKKKELEKMLNEIKQIRLKIENKKREISDKILILQKEFVDFGEMIPRVRPKEEEKKIEVVEKRQKIDIEKLKKEFEKLKDEFETF